MEILSIILAAVTPLVVVQVTGAVKKLQTIDLAPNRVALVRAVAAVLAVAGSALTAIAGGAEFDPTLVESALQALVSFGVATYAYHLAKK